MIAATRLLRWSLLAWILAVCMSCSAAPATPATTPAPPPADLTLMRQALLPTAQADLDAIVRALNPPQYAIDAAFDPERSQVSGSERITYTNRSRASLNELYLRLLPNLPDWGQASVLNLAIDGRPVTPRPELGGSALRIPLEPPLRPGDRLTLQLDFVVSVPTRIAGNYGAFAFYDDVLALAAFYPFIPVYDDEGWNVEIPPSYGDVVYAETGLFLVRFQLPAGWDVAASGSIVSSRDNGDGTVTWTIVAAPMREFNLIASPEFETLKAHAGEVLLRAHVKPADAAGGRRALTYARQALTVYEEMFGPYPFQELEIAATPTTAGGIEYPGLIVIADRLLGQSGGFFEWVVAHEVAHQWWYSLVGNDQIDEPWLDEALAQYSALLYTERVHGRAAAEAALEDLFERPYRQLRATGRDQPAGLPVGAYRPEDYGSVVYSKGPLFFHALRQAMGEESFEAFLRAYAARHRYRIATPASMLYAAVEACQCDALTPYAHWIMGADLTPLDEAYRPSPSGP